MNETSQTISNICLDLKEIVLQTSLMPIDIKGRKSAADLLEIAIDSLYDAQLIIDGLVDCDICGDYHESDSIPLSCQTGDGE